MPSGIYKRKSTKVEVKCQYCGILFKVYPSDIKVGRGKYHLKKCYNLSMIGRKLPDKIKQKMSDFAKGRIHTKIAKRRMSEAKRGEKNYNWSGGIKENRKRMRNKLKNDLKYKLRQGISTRIRRSLGADIKNGRNWEDLVGYTIRDLKNRLYNTIPQGYTWKDFLNGDLHIDHIIPVAVFNFEKPEDFQFRQCWNLDNLRLLPKKENLRKSNKLIKPFQMGLAV